MSDPLQNLLGPIFQARQQATPGFLARQNVVACGVGYKIKGQTATTTPSVMVSVTRKIPADQLHPADLIPAMIQNVPTDVVETGEIVAFGVDRTVALRPARPGTSVGNINGATGTISCIVKRGDQSFILSNNHVLAMLNQGKPGDVIVQPGTADGGTLADQVAALTQFAPITFSADVVTTGAAPAAAAQSTQPQGCAVIVAQLFKSLLDSLSNLRTPTTALPPPPAETPGNLVDAAIAAPIRAGLLDPAIVDIGAPPQGIAEAKLGMQVFKSGRTSGVTEGIITQVDVAVNVKYNDQTAHFTNQIMITPCSQPGDSGSLILDFQRNAVGLVFSGSNLVTVANPIGAVLAALNVELVTAASAASPGPETG
jgi:hypothetical protein